jgi:2-polyprenyl-6-methoxyphenol hydroxylase-like FAD-dependent oxidoreductase
MGADKRVLIVGAGIAGLSLARALHQRDIAAEIVERAETRSRLGTGIYIPANGIRALDHLGLAEPLIARGKVNQRRRFLTAEGATSFEIDLVEFWGPGARCLGVGHTDLHDVLLAGVAGGPIRRGTTVDVLKEDAHGVSVVFDDGAEQRFDLVVAADGIRSSIRNLLFGEQHVVGRTDLSSASWRFVTACPSSVDCWTLFTGARAVFLILPIGHGRAYCFAAFTAREQVSQRPDHARFVSAFKDYADPVPEVLHQLERPDKVYYSPLEEISHPVWGRGRTVLIGDAAHAMPPTMAQGASLAVEDAIVLARLLDTSRNWANMATRLESQRNDRVTWVKQHTDRQSKLLTIPYAARKLAMRTAGEKLWKRSFSPLREPV